MTPSAGSLSRVVRFPRLRALAWSGDHLYASRGYDLLRAKILPGQVPSNSLQWEPVASFHPQLRRRLSVTNRLTARLFRDGFHALAPVATGGFVAAVPGAIITLRPNETEFHATHTITRGTRPLHITAVPNGPIYWGEYFDNPARDEVHIYASTDGEASGSDRKWSVAYTFPKGAIRHVHNIVHDPWGDCLWILTGDYGAECRILRASCDLGRIEVVRQGNQQARAVALVPTQHGLYFSSDTPLEQNYVYLLDRAGDLTQLAPITGSSIYGCRVGNHVFFSTMVEPSEANPDPYVRIFGLESGTVPTQQTWRSQRSWKKDRWPPGLFQYGNAFLPDGNNATEFLAVTTIAVEEDDQATSLYALS